MEERGRIPVSQPHPHPLPSYWHEPKSSLANVGSSFPSSAIYDHVIIGSGISGALIAYNLLNLHPGARIIVLEARELCGGAAGRNGGHTKAASYRTYLQHREDLGKQEALKIARLEYANIVETHALADKLGIDCEASLCNTVDLVYDEETFERGKESIEVLREDANADERGEGRMAWYKVYGREEAIAKFWASERNENPEVKDEERLVGAFEYQAGRINAYRFATGILDRCVTKGLTLNTNTPVRGIRPTGEGSVYRYDVLTKDYEVRTNSLILATNGYTPYLLPKLQGAIVPLRGQITAQQVPVASNLPSPFPTTYSFIYRSGYEYMIPRPLPGGRQHIVIGGGLGREPHAGANEYGTTDDSVLNSNISKYLRGSLVGYFGTSNWGETSNDDVTKRIVQEWTGIMGVTADGHPFVGEVPGMEAVWISAGFNGHGMVLCLKSAEALVRMISSRSSEKIEGFPESFLITEQRLNGVGFKGRTDLGVPTSDT